MAAFARRVPSAAAHVLALRVAICMAVLTGLEVALQQPPTRLRKSQAFGLVCNQASVTGQFVHAADALHERFPEQLRTLFGPQHGMWSIQQDNMIETPHASYRG
ncbi:MAG TPA: DUF1343 domain-containing protein, partial [Planctomycetes bacterium]|nr:DUF1343 domain-containing protein [Planctomycetota bacterium]